MLPDLKAAKEHFKDDIVAAFGLALVVLPLALGIAIASGVPPMAGVISVVVGGIVTTFLRSSQITINGPSAGLIAVIIAGVASLGEGDPIMGFRYVLAATVIAGTLQMFLGILRLGAIGDMVPSAAIQGMLAAVGIIIFSGQIHVIFGVDLSAESAIESIKSIPYSIANLNPIVTAISILAMIALYVQSRAEGHFDYDIPAPIWILLFTVPAVFLFNFVDFHNVQLFGGSYEVGPEFLVQIPDDIRQSFVSPNFDKWNRFDFWVTVLSITVIGALDSLMSAKGVDKLDSMRRQTNLSQELFAVGGSTIISGLIGGLPVITAVPVYSGAKTKWSNFYYGVILLLLVLIFPFVIQKTPLSALAILLIYTAYKLANPKLLLDTYRKGDDQFLIFIITLLAALSQGLLVGIVIGVMMTLFIHFAKANYRAKQFFAYLLNPTIEEQGEEEDSDDIYIKIEGIVNFVNIPKLRRKLRKAADKKQMVLDFSNTRLIDYTVLEYLHDEAGRFDIPGVQLELVGFDAHDTSSRHPNALRVLPDDKKPQLTQRQKSLKSLAEENNGTFWPEIRWDVSQLKNFQFFTTRAIEYRFNVAQGHYKMFFDWETCDITFEEGTLFASHERHTSVEILHLPFNAPVFVLQREDLIDKLGVRLSLKEEDINFVEHQNFSETFLLQGVNRDEVRKFFTGKLVKYLENNSVYHIESNGTMILVFKEMKFASPTNMRHLHAFSEGLADVLLANWKEQTLDLEALL